MRQEKATPTVQIDNNHLRVTEWRFAPGAATGYHRHEHDYVVVPARDGELKLIGPTGEVSFAKLQLGKSYFRNAGVEHDVTLRRGRHLCYSVRQMPRDSEFMQPHAR